MQNRSSILLIFFCCIEHKTEVEQTNALDNDHNWAADRPHFTTVNLQQLQFAATVSAKPISEVYQKKKRWF